MENETATPEIFKGWRMAADGRLTHENHIDPVDKARDLVVTKLIKKAQRMRHDMEIFRGKVDTAIDLHMEAMFQEHGVKMGGKQGGLTLTSFDGLLKVQRSIGGVLKFDERVKVAEELMRGYVERKGKTAAKEVKQLALDRAFQVNEAGDFNPAELSRLTKYRFDDDDWRRGCDLIHRSRYYVGKKPYVRFYERESTDDQWKAISLDMARI